MKITEAKRIIAVALSALIMVGVSVTLDAAPKKKARSRNTATVVATIDHEGLKLYSDGTIRGPYRKGTYKKQGNYYTYEWYCTNPNRCGDGGEEGVIVGSYIYDLGGGTDGCLSYTYRHSEGKIYYVDECEDTRYELSLLECTHYKVNWIKK